jgi:hypothetical protein
MEEFNREFFKKDEVFKELFEFLKSKHQVANHTKKVLYDNRHIKDFCEIARHYIMMPGKNPLYIHYDVSSWYKHPQNAQVRIDSIGIYDDFMEYEVARVKGLHSAKSADIPNIN